MGRHLPDRRRPGRARGARVRRRTTTGSPSTGPTASPVHIETTRPELIPAVRRADRAPRRRALPAAVRHHGHLAGVRRRDPGARPPGRRARQGRRHRDVLHLRRPHRRAPGGASCDLPGPHRDRPRRPAAPRDARVARRTSRPRRRTPSWPARPPSAPARRWSRCCASRGDLDGEPKPTQRMANFYEKGDKPLEIVTTRQWYIRNGGRDAELRDELLARGARDHLGPGAHAAPLRQLGRRPQRRLADLAASGSSASRSRSGTRSTTRASPTTTTRCCRARPSCRSTRRREAPARLHRGPARQARRLRRRPRRHGHLGDLVADAADRRRLGAPTTTCSQRVFPMDLCHPGARHHPHLAVLPGRPRALRERRRAVVARADLRLHPRPRPQEDVQVQGQRRRPDRRSSTSTAPTPSAGAPPWPAPAWTRRSTRPR